MAPRTTVLSLLFVAAAAVAVATCAAPSHAAGPIALSLGGDHTCVLMTTGDVQCWGRNTSGQVGDGTIIQRRLTPINVVGLAPDIEAISAGSSHTCALATSGSVQCWGSNLSGQLGNGTFSNSALPTVVVSLSTPAIRIAAGGLHTCALLETGTVACWGRNEYGQLGDGTSGDGDDLTRDNNSPFPVSVIDLTGAIEIAAGGNHTCALLASGEMKCWGANASGELGDGTGGFDGLPLRFSALPVEVCQSYDPIAEECTEVLREGRAITAGSGHTCALLFSSEVRCWGANFDGQVGDGTTIERPTPAVVCQTYDQDAQQCEEPLSSISSVSAGSAHTCALAEAGAARCWGDNDLDYGQLGDGRQCGFTCPTPADVMGLSSEVISLATGHFHSCALLTAGIQCWGKNLWSQLGSGVCCNDSHVPVEVVGLGPKETPSATATPSPSPTLTSTPPAPPSATSSPTETIPVTGTSTPWSSTPLATSTVQEARFEASPLPGRLPPTGVRRAPDDTSTSFRLARSLLCMAAAALLVAFARRLVISARRRQQ